MSSGTGNIPEMIAAIASGRSLAETAKTSRMSVSTVQRRLREPEIQAQIDQSRVDLTRQALGRVRGLRDLALDRVAEILSQDESPGLTLRAAELILRHAAAADTAWLHDKVLQLEHRLFEASDPLEACDE